MDPEPGADHDVPAAVLADVVGTSPVGLVVVGPDDQVRYVNHQALAVLGLSRAELPAVVETFLSTGRPTAPWAPALDGRVAHSTVEAEHDHPDGRHLTLEVFLTRVQDGPASNHLVVRLTDRTAQRRLEAELRASEARYRLLVESLPGVVFVAEPGASGRWSYVSPQVEQMLGFGVEEWLADPTAWARQIHPDDRDEAIRHDSAPTAARGTTAPQTYRMLRRDRSVLWVRDGATVVADQGRLYYHGMLTDVTHERQLEDRLAYLATHDELTGLANRSSFLAALDQALSAADGPTAVAFLDLDGLKAINDTYGHVVGDQLLRNVGAALAQVPENLPGVVVCRFAGDEFAAFGSGPGFTQAGRLGAALLAAVQAASATVDDRVLTGRASVGTAVAWPGQTADDVIAAADRAMYRAKSCGGGQVWSDP